MTNRGVLVAALRLSAFWVREIAQGEATAKLGLYGEHELMRLTKALFEVASTLDDEATTLERLGIWNDEPPLGIPR